MTLPDDSALKQEVVYKQSDDISCAINLLRCVSWCFLIVFFNLAETTCRSVLTPVLA